MNLNFFIVSSITLSSLLVTTSNSQSTTDVPVLTIDPDFYGVLTARLPNDYEIENNVYTWNFTEVYNLLTEDQPDLFYSLPTSALYTISDLMLEWLGETHPDIIAFHKLCNFLSTADQILYNCTTNSTFVELNCPDPFVDSDRYSVFYDGCNLNCKYSNLLWGMPDESVDRLFAMKYTSVALSLPLLFIVFVNQYWDSKHSKEYFCQRPLITQSTLMIIIAFANIFAQWLIIPMIGENNVLCQDELNGAKGVSFGNPEAGWTPCLIFGIHFYMNINMLVVYVVVFTLSLWKQFYAPLRSVWAQIGCATMCDNICLLFETVDLNPTSFKKQSTTSTMGNRSNNSTNSNEDNNNNNNNRPELDIHSGTVSDGIEITRTNTVDNINNDINNTGDNNDGEISRTLQSSRSSSRRSKRKRTFQASSHMDRIESDWKRSNWGRSNCGLCCISCLCSSNLKYHVILFIGNVAFTVALCLENIIDAFHPLGICYGGGTNEWRSWWYTVFPLFFGAMVLCLFIPAAIYLLCKTRRNVASKTAKETLNHLGFRLSFYYFGICFAMVMIVFMSWRNNSIRGKLTIAAERRFECVLFGGTFNECVNADDYHLPEYTFWFLYWAVVCAMLSTVVVTMHAKQIQRWINFCPCLKYILAFGDEYLCKLCDKDRTLMKIIDGTYFIQYSSKEKTRTKTKNKKSKGGSKGSNNSKDSKDSKDRDGTSGVGDQESIGDDSSRRGGTATGGGGDSGVDSRRESDNGGVDMTADLSNYPSSANKGGGGINMAAVMRQGVELRVESIDRESQPGTPGTPEPGPLTQLNSYESNSAAPSSHLGGGRGGGQGGQSQQTNMMSAASNSYDNSVNTQDNDMYSAILRVNTLNGQQSGGQ